MIIWKNIAGKSVSLYPSGKMIDPDQTFKSNGLFYADMTEEGYDLITYEDFVQPTVKSYITSIGNGTASDVFVVGSSITIPEFLETERLVFAITDGADAYITGPTDKVKIFTNLHATGDLNVAPFSYMISPIFEYNRVKFWLKRLTIQNTTGASIKVWVQVQRFNEFDANWHPRIVI